MVEIDSPPASAPAEAALADSTTREGECPESSPKFTGDLADPVVTANVYCAERLDRIVLEPLAELREKLRGELGPGWRLWYLRYRKCGEHIKVRIHAERAAEAKARELVKQAFEPWLAAQPELAQLPAPTRGIPAIDPEDRRGEEYPDRSLLFTTWERSHVSLGASPLLEDDRYVALLTRWLATSADLALDELQLDGSGTVPHKLRQNLLIKVVLASLASLDLGQAERVDYLHYHRDWLLRFNLLKVVDREEKAKDTVRRFAGQVGAMGAMTAVIGRTLERIFAGQPEANHPLGELAGYLERFRGQDDFRVDPFTTEPSFPGVFKGLHGSANQFGLSMLNEAFAYHLMLHVADPERAAQPPRLMPG